MEEQDRKKKEYLDHLSNKIDVSRAANLEHKVEKKTEEKQQEKDFQAYWQTRNQQLVEIEANEKQKIKEKNKQLMVQHLKQIKEKQVLVLK